ncbi:PREDICTED: protein S100-A14, partial [Nestor notabilis]|uniref:protein S100-A14 n=1 Tax=Nestor notabilis TaxID=176057 RepID=UPI00052332C1
DVPSLEEKMQELDVNKDEELKFSEYWRLMGELDCQELTDVERAIETVINQFHCYAVKGQKEYLTPNEMQELVVQKLPHLGKCVGPLEEKIECMGDPDEAKLEFGEYWDMMGDAAKGCRRK